MPAWVLMVAPFPTPMSMRICSRCGRARLLLLLGLLGLLMLSLSLVRVGNVLLINSEATMAHTSLSSSAEAPPAVPPPESASSRATGALTAGMIGSASLHFAFMWSVICGERRGNGMEKESAVQHNV